MSYEYVDVAGKVVEWANDRNLIKGSTASNQFIKLVEELSEVKNSKSDEELLKEIGDYHVVSIIMLEQLGVKGWLDYRASFESLDWIDLLGDIAADLSKSRCAKRSIVAGMNCVNDYLPEHFTPTDALAAAFNKIKDRKGKMINGVFVKEEDL